MQEAKTLEQAFDAIKDSFILPTHNKELREKCEYILKAYNANEQMRAVYMNMFSQSNYEGAKSEFINKVKDQIVEWKPIFEKQREVRVCLKTIKMKEFDLKKDDIEKLLKLFEEPPIQPKHQLIKRFIVYLTEMFILIGDRYMSKYDLSSDWRADFQSILSIFQDIFLVSYKKYCKFYHKKLQEAIRFLFSGFDYIRNVEEMQRDFVSHAPSTIKDSAITSILKMNAKTNFTKNFQSSMQRHNQAQLWNQLRRINKLYKVYLLNEVNFDFLQASQIKNLCFVLGQQFRRLDYTDKQKKELKKLLSVQNLKIDIWSVNEDLNVWNLYFSEEKTQQTLVCLFIALTRGQYTGTVRHYLQYVFRRLADLQYDYSNYQILIQLENKNLTYNKTLDLMRTSKEVVDKEIRQILINIKKEDQLDGDVPKLMTFLRIGNLFTKSRVITIFISGFTCQDSANAQSWRYLLHKGETYAMNWQCLKKGVSNMFKLSSVVPIARNTGKYLAHFIKRTFKNYLVNLVGFSLGTELISCCLAQLKEDINCINKIVLLGGVAHVPKLQEILGENAVEVINCWTEKDLALKAGLAIFQKKFRPCGLNEIGGPNIRNVDTTKISNWYGHRVTHIELRKHVEFETDFLYSVKE